MPLEGPRVVLAGHDLVAHAVRILLFGDAAHSLRPTPELSNALRCRSLRAPGCSRVRSSRRVASTSRLVQRAFGIRLERRRQRGIVQHSQCLIESVRRAGGFDCASRVISRSLSIGSDLREVASARARNQRIARDELRRPDGRRASNPAAAPAASSSERRAQLCEQMIHAGIVEAAGDRRKHRHLRVRQPRLLRMIAPPLLAHVAQGIFRAALFELVEHDHVREVEHVDLLELARRAVLAGHDVERHDRRGRRSRCPTGRCPRSRPG